MAVPEQTPYIEHTGNSVTTSFSLGFQCESKDHLIVLVDEIEPPIATWSLIGGNVVFTTAPAAGSKIKLQRNTPFGRTTDYQSFNNSFRPQSVNGDFDRIWLKLQELGVADWLLKLYVDRLHQQQEEKINDLKVYVDDRDNELRSYLMEEIRKQGVALDQLDEYYNYLMQRLAQIAVDKGWDASFIVSADGSTQQEINDFGGAKWWPKPLGYNLGATVKLENGDIVKNTIPENTANPNLDMTGWAFASRTMLQSIADMLAISNPKDGSSVYVKAYEQGTGLGGGEFTYDAGSTETANNVTIFGTGTGRWKRPAGQVITPYHAGAVDGTDAIDALDRFAAFVKADAGKTQIKVAGNFNLSHFWNFNCQGQQAFHWDLKLKAIQPMAYMVALRGTNVHQTGKLLVTGQGTASNYDTYTVDNGVLINGCQGSVLPIIQGSVLKYHAAATWEGAGAIPLDGLPYANNTNTEITKIHARNCGARTFGYLKNKTISTTFSSPVHTGTASTESQRTTIILSDTPLPAPSAGTGTFYAVINNRTYQIMSYDNAARTVSLFPWMDTTEPTSGSIDFFWGGGLNLIGNNSSPFKIGGIDAIFCGSALIEGAFYGATTQFIIAQFCGAGHVLGISPNSISPQSTSVIGMYTEGLHRDVLLASQASAQYLNRSGAFADEAFKNCEKIVQNNRSGDGGAFSDAAGWKRVFMPTQNDNGLDGIYYKGKSKNKQLNGSGVNVSNRDIAPRVYKKNSWTVTLQYNDQLNMTKGLDDAFIGFIGTGTNAAPTGAFTFNPPADWTVNGTTSAVFSGFSGPALFMCYWDVVAKNVSVSQITQKMASQVDSAATDVAALKSDFNALLAKMRAAGLM